MSDLELLQETPGETITLTAEPEEFFRRHGRGKVVVFTGKRGVEANGAGAEFAAACPGAACFDGVEAEPGVVTVERMVDFLCAEVPDSVFAIGGGSVLDAGKAALLVWQTGTPLRELFGSDRWSAAYPGARLRRIIAVPTTSGTGSEATPYANIVDRESGVKKLIREELTVPEFACVVPRYAATMPRSVTLATGCDALAHLIEGFINTRADGNHPRADVWALRGIELVVRHLSGALADDPEAREKMAVAAALGGMTIRFKSTGLPHLCSFSWFGRIPHGIAAILLLPECWRFYLGNPAVRERTIALRGVFPGRSAEEIIDSFRAFLTRLGVPENLRAYPEITPELLERTAVAAGENKMKLELAPRPVPVEQSAEILRAILNQTYGD